MKSVSVYVPCYNYAHFLRDCVRSVLSQEGVEVQVLIIDDASSDDSQAVGMELAEQDSRVEYRRHRENRGHIATYNEGIEWASYDYTVLLSADDMLTPGSLSRATDIMEAHPHVSMVHGTCAFLYDGEPRPDPRLPEGDCDYVVHTGADWLETICRRAHNRIWAPEAIVRTDLQKKVGGYNPDLPHSGDMEMWMRFASHGDIGEILNADQAFYRRHQRNMHRGYSALADAQQRKVAFDAFFDEFGHRVEARDYLALLADRGIARDAYWAACWIFDRDPSDREAIAEVVAYAKDTYRGISHDWGADRRQPRALIGYLRARMAYAARMQLGSRVWPVIRPVMTRFEISDAYS